MEYPIHPEKGWVNIGNLFRIKQFMQRAESGDRMTVAFFGGSITQGSVASTYTKCYAYLVFEWLMKQFNKTAFSYVNAGVGGTSSQFGVARVDEDVLSYKPDLVFVEFSVNDENDEFYKETYEGLIRKLYQSPYAPAIILVHNMFYDTGKSAEEVHRQIGSYYDLPSISMKSAIYREIVNGNINADDITPDYLHPNDDGHRLLADVIIKTLQMMYDSRNDAEIPFYMPEEPLTENCYEGVQIKQNYNCKPVKVGFNEDLKIKKYVNDMFVRGWTADDVGATINFLVEGTEIAVQYRRTINTPAPVAVAIVDGDEDNPIILDGNFDEDWGDCLSMSTLLHHGEKGFHMVEIKIIETHEDDKTPFYLVSVISA